MTHSEILSRVDHTILTPGAVWEEVKTVCEEAERFHTASVCLSPCFVRPAAEVLGQRVKICTVIGFPSGCHTTEAKVFEAEDAVRSGADELDMVMALGAAKAGDWDAVTAEIRAVKAACHGRVLKVIVEACLLTRQEKAAACRAVSEGGADFIKTSTGFSTGGATEEDVALFRAGVAPGVRVKAAGGIRTWEAARRFLELGADRIGASALVKLAIAEGL